MSQVVSDDAVQALAYQLWEERGCVGGSPEDDWHRAREMLSERQRAGLHESALHEATSQGAGSEHAKATAGVDRAVEESFPASDPPAIHVKDDPPVNAGAKWQAAKKGDGKGRSRGATR